MKAPNALPVNSGRPRRRMAAAVATAAALTVAAAAVAALAAWTPPRAAATAGPRAGTEPTAAVAVGERALVEVDVAGLGPAAAARLARRVPEWEEALVAGSDRIVLPAERLAQLRRDGFDLATVGWAPAAPAGWPDCYRTLDEQYLWADAFAARHPWLVAVLRIGQSHCKTVGGCRTADGELIEGRDLLVLHVTNRLSAAPKTGRLFVDGGLHGREVPGPEVVMAFVEHLVAAYGVDPQVTHLLDHAEVLAGINSNPDGRALVELGARTEYGGQPWLWRKNARPDPRATCAWPPTSSNHFGVDLNRNHSFRWDAPGHSTAPCSVTFAGRRRASEPETRSMEDFVRSRVSSRRGPDDDDTAPPDTAGVLINLHNATVPGIVLTPWGWTSRPAPDGPDLEAIAYRYAELAGGYRVSNALYAVSGTLRDWAYGELGIPAYVVELEGRSFVAHCDDLPQLVHGQKAPLRMALALSDRPYERVRGPEVTDVEHPPAARPGEPLTVRARLDASRLAGRLPAGAEVTVGVPGGRAAGAGLPVPAVEPGAGLAMVPVDGAFDAAVEWAELTLDTRELAPGTYSVVVRGRGDDGHWGPVHASFVRLAEATPGAGNPTASPTSEPPTPVPDPATALPVPETGVPTAEPTEEPTKEPTEEPTALPAATATVPSAATATSEPTGTVTPAPTALPAATASEPAPPPSAPPGPTADRPRGVFLPWAGRWR